jgi:uncharacterized protein YegJ (DUF2314 family)
MGFFKNLFRRKNNDSFLVSKRSDNPDVYHVPSEEESMNAAIDKAQRTVGYFMSSLNSPTPEQQYFSAKAKIEDNGEIEHIWLNDVSFDDSGNLFGKIGNEPLSLKNVKIGQEVGVAKDELSDWMIVESGRLIGGYTLRVLRDKMSPKEQKSFDAGVGLYIDEGADYFPHDFSTPEGAILSLEDAYDAGDLERAAACKDFDEEAKQMLSSLKSGSQLSQSDEVVKEMAEVLRLAFIKSVAENLPSFEGVTRAFPKREIVRDDLVIVTEVCIYPDGTKSSQRLYVFKKDDAWKVLNVVD